MVKRAATRPYLSVVINCLNEEKTLGAALDSLMNQTYPRKQYEIIVVNDGSTDNTEKIAKSYPRVRYIGWKVNRGIPAACNAGMKAAKGKIFVGFNADCVAKPTWLAELAKGYEQDNPIGVCGSFIEPQPIKGIANRYISASDSNVAVRLSEADSGSNNPIYKVWRYIRGRVKHSQPPNSKVAVTELYGANGSFPLSVLRRVGGWQDSMFWIEDRDICRRIREAYPGRNFYLMPKAVVVHGAGLSLREHLLRPYKRGPVNLAFHRKNKLTLPIFPFPFLFAFLCTFLAVLYPAALPAAAVLLPQLLYFWWPMKAFRSRTLTILLFPYIQLAEESMVFAGLARGYVLLARTRTAKIMRPITGLLHFVLTLAVITGWMSIIIYTKSTPLHAIVSIPFLLIFPGLCAWKLFTISKEREIPGTRILFYSVGLSLLILMLTGLLLNEAYVLFWLASPLGVLPLTFAIGGLTAYLALLAFILAPNKYRLVNLAAKSFKIRLVPDGAALAIGFLLPILAVAGAVSLNNGNSNSLALLAMGAIAALILLMVFRHAEISRYYSWFLYSICLSILLGTSMRGWNITGHDVMQEFQVFQLTATHAAWHMRYYQDAYMACLSITILPTIFQKLTGISDPFIFKFVFQLFAALIAPVMFSMLIPYAGKRRALLAVCLFMTFPTFLTDIMMLNRQETALLFLALSLLAGLDTGIGPRLKSLLGFLFLTGMVLSHYSTSYVALGALLIALVLAAVWRVTPLLLRRGHSPPFGQLTSIYSAPVIIAALLVLITWGSIATQTANNINRTINSIATTVSQQASAVPHNAAPPPTSVAGYAALATQRRSTTSGAFYDPAAIARYPLEYSPEYLLPLSRPLSRLGIQSDSLAALYTALRSVYVLAIEGLIVIGLLIALIIPKRNDRLPLQYLFFGVGTLILIGSQVILPSGAIDYSVTRVIQEALLVLALPMVLAGLWILRMAHVSQRACMYPFALGIVGFYVLLSGLLPTVTGSFKPALALSNTGFYYEAYYTHQEEIAAAHWMDTSTPVGSHVYSDEFMRRKLITYANIFAEPTLVPGAIPMDSYVLLNYGDTVFRQVPAYAGANVIYYQPPTDFLAASKNTVYSSTNVTIYK